ncbi:unnamed protein product [Brassicogethes aeneus]|uniref:Uncharacterized protein n=1 Tax=Brassicogethes aeneus TaxID=1431903 RepID=A0A9P0AZ24_BRAAE|nr:unnamed protein product [Brassicogethes aeneus]
MDDVASDHGIHFSSEPAINEFSRNRNPMMCTAHDGHHKVNAAINPALVHIDLGIKEEGLKTSYLSEYQFKVSQDNPLIKLGKAPRSNDYGRTMEEKVMYLFNKK